jgi:hypothetical protein
MFYDRLVSVGIRHFDTFFDLLESRINRSADDHAINQHDFVHCPNRILTGVRSSDWQEYRREERIFSKKAILHRVGVVDYFRNDFNHSVAIIQVRNLRFIYGQLINH